MDTFGHEHLCSVVAGQLARMCLTTHISRSERGAQNYKIIAISKFSRASKILQSSVGSCFPAIAA